MSLHETARKTLQARCCIAGGGPAGMMLGLLLARAGVDVIVLEKHADFLRDFRGDTIHPSTLEVMHELGLLDDFLKRPHEEVQQAEVRIGGRQLIAADFSQLPTQCKFLAFMPQWEFLDFIAEHARAFPAFQLQTQAEVTDLLRDGERVVGVQAQTPQGLLDVHADLVVAADGRGSTVRERAGLAVIDVGAPMDVLWMRLPRRETDPSRIMFRIDDGRIMILLNRDDYWQCAFVIPKGGLDDIRAQGLPAFRDGIVRLMPELHDRVDALQSWDDIKLLTVAVNRLRRWYRPGLLCIGDAAHAMSPVGGVGINLAIQDAVAAANLLAPALSGEGVTEAVLAAVQKRRMLPTRMTQWMQVLLQNQVIRRVLGRQGSAREIVPWPLRLLQAWPWLQRIPARVIGMGFRPEHVRVAAARRSVMTE
ncbi:MAG: FAD-dependent oxidoreductase [Stenotrophobium sp.]